ncbi:MAG: hypothetical protein J5940_02045 [Clostridia bacterium]|nr:hypothetical protein [Clostridia bacterium]
MSEFIFSKALELFREECEKWCAGLLDNCNNDYCQATEELCRVMHDRFFTPPERIKDIATYLNATKIEQVVSSLSKDSKFRYSSSIPYYKNEVSDEWVLTKSLKGKRSELTIQLCFENYIHICSWTDDWNLIAYCYRTLEDAIVAWAEGHM